jgi:hypothetical protein
MATAVALCLSQGAKALDNVPELSLEVAKKMAAACEAKSKEQNWKMNISVVNDGAVGPLNRKRSKHVRKFLTSQNELTAKDVPGFRITDRRRDLGCNARLSKRMTANRRTIVVQQPAPPPTNRVHPGTLVNPGHV